MNTAGAISASRRPVPFGHGPVWRRRDLTAASPMTAEPAFGCWGSWDKRGACRPRAVGPRRQFAKSAINQVYDKIQKCFSDNAFVEKWVAGPGMAPFAENRLRSAVKYANRAVVVVDIVASTRLIELDELGTISRWLDFVQRVEADILPNEAGRLVKSLGDGMLLEFQNVKQAVAAAIAIQDAITEAEAEMPDDRAIRLSIGVELCDLLVDARDVYGHGVNLAARLCALAGPGEVVVSAAVQDRLTQDIDGDIEDLGECFVKHLSEPLRAYRIRGARTNDRPEARHHVAALLPTVAVLPLEPWAAIGADQRFLGDVLVDTIIETLSRSQSINVISRLSTAAFRGRTWDTTEIHRHLNADYAVSGSYWLEGQRVHIAIELSKLADGAVIWSRRFTGDVDHAGQLIADASAEIASDTTSSIVRHELVRARLLPIPTLEAHTLLLSAVALMHRQTLHDFQLAHDVLDELVTRMPRHPIPWAWLAHWQVLKMQQGWSSDIDRDGRLALDQSKRALDIDPECAIALTADGLVNTHFPKRLDTALDRYRSAVAANPNNALSWLLKGALHAFMDDGQTAVDNSERALALSPLDPHRYYFDTLSATSSLAAGENTRALELADRSLRANRRHSSTLRVKVAALWRLGRYDEARTAARELLKVEPRFTVSGWLERTPSASFKLGEEFSDILRNVGVPE